MLQGHLMTAVMLMLLLLLKMLCEKHFLQKGLNIDAEEEKIWEKIILNWQLEVQILLCKSDQILTGRSFFSSVTLTKILWPWKQKFEWFLTMNIIFEMMVMMAWCN